MTIRSQHAAGYPAGTLMKVQLENGSVSDEPQYRIDTQLNRGCEGQIGVGIHGSTEQSVELAAVAPTSGRHQAKRRAAPSVVVPLALGGGLEI